MGKKSSPKPPDYAALAEQTAGASREATTAQTWANRANQNNPWGSVSWQTEQVIDPATGQPVTQWTQNVELNEAQQKALEDQQAITEGRSGIARGMLEGIGDIYSSPMDFSQYGEAQNISGAGEGIQRQFDAGGIGAFNPGQFDKPGQLDTRVRDDFQFQDPGLDRQQYQTDLDFSGAPQIDDPRFTAQRAEESAYERGASRLDPQFAQEEQALDVRLRSQGLSPGDEGYDAQMRNFQDRKTDAYANLERQAQQEGFRQAEGMFGMQAQHRGQMTGETAQQGQFRNLGLGQQFQQDLAGRGQDIGLAEMINQFGQTGDIQSLQAALQQRGQDVGMRGQDINAMIANIGQQVQQNALGLQAQGMGNAAQQQAWNQMLQQTNMGNQLRSQARQEGIQERNMPLNELTALLTGQQIGAPQFQGYNQANRAEHANYLGAGDMQHQAAMAGFGADQALLNSLMSGAGQVGGMFAMSDRRLKRNIQKIGEIGGVNWYEFDYVWGEHAVGVMADEVPWAAFDTPSGFKAVNYGRIY